MILWWWIGRWFNGRILTGTGRREVGRAWNFWDDIETVESVATIMANVFPVDRSKPISGD